jgi:hypothetical protein
MLGVVTEIDTTLNLKAKQDIPIGHKVALKALKKGDTIIKYGEDIGRMVADAGVGSTPCAEPQDQALDAKDGPQVQRKACQGQQPEFTAGAENGRVGVRNHVVILPLDDLPTPPARRSPTTSRASWPCRTRTAACSSAT